VSKEYDNQGFAHSFGKIDQTEVKEMNPKIYREYIIGNIGMSNASFIKTKK